MFKMLHRQLAYCLSIHWKINTVDVCCSLLLLHLSGAGIAATQFRRGGQSIQDKLHTEIM